MFTVILFTHVGYREIGIFSVYLSVDLLKLLYRRRKKDDEMNIFKKNNFRYRTSEKQKILQIASFV